MTDNKIIEKELRPEFENVTSYYGKAILKTKGNITYLFSYNTLVAYINHQPSQLNHAYMTHENNLLTSTTLRHIKEFFKQFNKKADTKKQMLNDYGQNIENVKTLMNL